MSESVAVENANSAVPPPPSELDQLKTKLKVLTNLTDRLQVARQIPALLARPPSMGLPPGLEVAEPPTLRHEFQILKDLAETLKSAPVQEALTAARHSEVKDSSSLIVTRPHDGRKRKRAPSPESPQPFRPLEPKQTSLFPEVEQGLPPVTLSSLPAYIREYNAADHPMKTRIYSPARDRLLVCPVVLRCVIQDVATAYLTLDESPRGSPLTVVSVAVFGPRERKPPHSQSDFTVHQKLSQQIAKVIQSRPHANVRAVIHLLCAYHDLFVAQCKVCVRVMSLEGHVPPLLRIWTKLPDGTMGWDPRHSNCSQPS